MWVFARVNVPSVHPGFGREVDVSEGTLLAPFLPPFRNERRVEEAGMREVVDDHVDDLLGKRIHDRLVLVAGIWARYISSLDFITKD